MEATYAAAIEEAVEESVDKGFAPIYAKIADLRRRIEALAAADQAARTMPPAGREAP